MAATAAVLVAPASAAPVPDGAVHSEHYFPSADGTSLHADVFRPAGRRGKVPVILLVSPYTASGPTEQGPPVNYTGLVEDGEIFRRGYAYVQVSLRGVGGSGGCGDMGGKGEQADAKAAVEWAASQPWSTGKVGMWGVSYDAWTQVMALATKPKGLAAAIIASPLIDYYRGLYMNGVHYAGGWHATPTLYAAGDLTPSSVHSPPQQHVNAVRGTAENPDCYAQNLVESERTGRKSAYWQERDLVARASGSTVPVLWSHGFLDAATKPDNFLDVYSRLAGPHRGRFGQFGHRGVDSGGIGRDVGLEQSLRWFDRYLKGSRAPIRDAAVEVQQGDGRWRAERQWPPTDMRRVNVPLQVGTYTDIAGNNAVGRSSGIGSWTFTQALPYDVHLAGVPRLTLQVDIQPPGANLVALVYDVDAEGEAALITRGAATISIDGGLSFDLYPQDWRLPAGHHLGVLLSGSDDSWFDPGHTNSQVKVLNGSLQVPFLHYDRDAEPYLEGDAGADLERTGRALISPATIDDRMVTSPLPPKMTPRRRR
ncbi:MAG TPA: CocE/NonD family hydrolase [Mycobacteriales bacterium]|nr:CocE/NonD family hydrolase [Mycobacteriales bacterium]